MSIASNERNENGLTVLFVASREGNVDEVARLLAMGADANVQTFSPHFEQSALHVAANLDVVRLLIENGANIDALDRWGRTPLFRHCVNRRLSCIEFLCFKGANVNHQESHGFTTTVVAVGWGHTVVIKVLAGAFDADVDLVSRTGESPLIRAVAVANLDAVRLLLALNADTTKVDNTGRTVSQTTNEKIKQLLLEHSKKSEKERQELRKKTLNRIKQKVAIRLMRYAQPEIIGICLAMSSLELPPYVLLWIIDWLPNYDRLSHHKKIHLIESVRASIWKIKGKSVFDDE